MRTLIVVVAALAASAACAQPAIVTGSPARAPTPPSACRAVPLADGQLEVTCRVAASPAAVTAACSGRSAQVIPLGRADAEKARLPTVVQPGRCGG